MCSSSVVRLCAGVFIAGAGSLWTVGYADKPCKLGGEVNEVDETAMPCTYSRWRSSYLASSNPHKILFGGPPLVQVMIWTTLKTLVAYTRVYLCIAVCSHTEEQGGWKVPHGGARRMEGTIFFISKKNVHYGPPRLPHGVIVFLSPFLKNIFTRGKTPL